MARPEPLLVFIMIILALFSMGCISDISRDTLSSKANITTTLYQSTGAHDKNDTSSITEKPGISVSSRVSENITLTETPTPKAEVSLSITPEVSEPEVTLSVSEPVIATQPPIEIELSRCKKMEKSDESDACYFELAVKYNDIDICLNIKDNNMIESGRDGCIKTLAKKLKNEELCRKIEDSRRRYDCFTELSEIKADPEICNNIDPKEYAINTCYARSAPVAHNPVFCEMINDKLVGLKDICYKNTAIYDNGIKDTEFCEKIKILTHKKQCIAIISENLVACDNISDYTERYRCYYYVARRTDNRSICQKIEDSVSRKECEDYFQQQIISV